MLERCASRGRSWNYVLKALTNETASPDAPETVNEMYWVEQGQSEETASADAPESLLLPQSVNRGFSRELPVELEQIVGNVWAAALHQFEQQLGSDYQIWGRELTLVDYEAETGTFVAVARSEAAREMLQQRLYRALRRIMGDVAGRAVELRFLVAEEWLGQGSADEQIA